MKLTQTHWLGVSASAMIVQDRLLVRPCSLSRFAFSVFGTLLVASLGVCLLVAILDFSFLVAARFLGLLGLGGFVARCVTRAVSARFLGGILSFLSLGIGLGLLYGILSKSHASAQRQRGYKKNEFLHDDFLFFIISNFH